MHQAVHYQGGEPDAANHIYRYVNQHDAFEGAVYRHWWFQTSTWNKGQDSRSKQLNRWGAAMRDDILVSVQFGLFRLIHVSDHCFRLSCGRVGRYFWAPECHKMSLTTSRSVLAASCSMVGFPGIFW